MIQRTPLSSRVLLAKYVPDLRRQEPRNIGVIVWSDGCVGARFAGEDSRKPTGMPSDGTYDQWISYWRHQLDQKSIRSRNGDQITRESGDFLERLVSLSKPQYQLVESGGLLDPVDEDSIQNVVDQLFAELVTEIKPEDEQKQQSKKRLLFNTSKRLVRRSGLMNKEGYRENFPYVCRVNDTPLSFNFDYAVFNNGPQLAMSRVSEDSADVYSAAYQFQHMRVKLSREQLVSLVFAEPEDLERDSCRNSHEVLSEHTTLINLADEETATDQLVALAE